MNIPGLQEVAQPFAHTAAVTPTSDDARVTAIVKAVVRTAVAWELTNRDAASLFDVPIATWNRMKAGSYHGRLDQDKMTRASLILGIYKGLRLLFDGPLTYGWVTRQNAGSGFHGQKPLEVMINGGIPAMMAVRQHIDALRGGL
ncbi:DUF2384 domain-containing protein [Kiloniella laminariae]|uniref:DUF2384 domain-containing protein n=1 Tax=Kiloniella laminariae TaxID=454162 RepID=A0ABT4LFK0_9PROT|nr:antitoxin Xre/MbcA/ParS toxin-binding domain-containing protein [Kiloniella laminariae]MCZ4279864.1 DUF2384 domain-containing protein [Kiloniella laminariae]